jgi:hypothetical protein
MRFEGDGDEYFPNQGALWEANLARHFSGREGQARLRELRDALLALPEKRLIPVRLADEGGQVCALGAMSLRRRLNAGEGLDTALAAMTERVIEDEWGIDGWEAEQATIGEGLAMGCKMPFIVAVSYENDLGGPNETPEARYERVLAWVEKRILEPVA